MSDHLIRFGKSSQNRLNYMNGVCIPLLRHYGINESHLSRLPAPSGRHFELTGITQRRARKYLPWILSHPKQPQSIAPAQAEGLIDINRYSRLQKYFCMLEMMFRIVASQQYPVN